MSIYFKTCQKGISQCEDSDHEGTSVSENSVDTIVKSPTNELNREKRTYMNQQIDMTQLMIFISQKFNENKDETKQKPEGMINWLKCL